MPAPRVLKRHLPGPTALSKSVGKNPGWYKDAIIYELRVLSFYDDNGDGIGDFRGLASRLDYLQNLGITAIWLLPFYPSPMRDDGYDIAEYTGVQQECGTLADFEYFLDQAHRRGIRVITELVLNHTSDRHPWFKRARLAPPGSSDRDFYVWSETIDRYREARIIFKDFEPSNWSWDPLAKSYYWHRFYAHQPDLNFENPAVQEALLGVVDFWLARGVDGLRLDAVPYLFEAEGTNCENLPATHDFLKKLRTHIDQKFEDRMLLAEANQWPEDAAAYFGQGDECHMNFHFPIMPRMFMAIHMEDRFPILDILAQTPQIPANCQWALFLRNHDELTLEMVTDEERDYMYRAYATDTEMRINLGIRRRLAPLVGNDRRKMELLATLLFSLPGTPVLYYGDEIGMGDNIFLGDRNGVRTPMQWSSDRNAGFSRANPQRLILPITIDPEYHYEAINVEAQDKNPNSLLWWTKRLIALRKRYVAFGRGSIEFLTPTNYRVLAFIRAYGDETVLVVANLSRFVQYVELDLSKWKGTRPVELMGHTEFPEIGDLPYLLTLGGHASYWFSLESPPTGEEAAALAAQYSPPVIHSVSPDDLLKGSNRRLLEQLLPAFLYTRRWFSNRVHPVTAAHIDEAVALGSVHLLIARVEYGNGEPERFVLPLTLVHEARPLPAQAIVCTIRTKDGDVTGVDALEDGFSARGLLDAILHGRRADGREGTFVATAFSPIQTPDAEPSTVSAHHSAVAIRYGDDYLLKVFRRFDEGICPELEINRFLTARAAGVSPAVAGAIELQRPRGEPYTLAVLQAYVPNGGTAWTQAREELLRYYERALTRHREDPAPTVGAASLMDVGRAEIPAAIREVVGSYLETAALLGRRTGEMHLALASSSDDPAFAPEPYTTLDRRSKYQSMRNAMGKTLRRLREDLRRLPAGALPFAQLIIDQSDIVSQLFEPFRAQRLGAMRIRVHGDLHLGQVLYTGKDFVIIDFDGGATEMLSERRRKHSALRDVAGMIRSFHYAAFSAHLQGSVVRPEDQELAAPWAHTWYHCVAGTFLSGYLETTAGAPFIPESGELALVLNTHLLEKALFELRLELERCEETVTVPLIAISDLAGLRRPSPAPLSPAT